MNSGSSSLKIYCDTANLSQVQQYSRQDSISGFTTNPSIFRAQGINDYLVAAQQLAEAAFPKEVSLEVIADDGREMLRQARILRSLGTNTFVKIPVTNTLGSSTSDIVEELMKEGIPVNLTAVFTLNQIKKFLDSPISVETPLIISVFAGRLADIGQDPEEKVSKFVEFKKSVATNCRILWASPREVFNVIQAKRSGCDIITLTPETIAKMDYFGKDPEVFSLETVRMFVDDANKSGYSF
jgi:transaldolase